MKPRVLPYVLLLFSFTSSVFAQWIHIRTVPVIASNQSQFQPSLARGMGNLSIAFDDPLADPFVNPAKANRLSGITLFSSPTRNSWSNENGRAISTAVGSSTYPGAAVSSIPFGGFIQRGKFFGGALVSYQGFIGERSGTRFDFPITTEPRLAPRPAMRSDIGSNTYLFGLFGVNFPESNTSVAGSITWGKYGAMDGVNLLYPGSIDIKQDGWSLEYKLGILGELTDNDRLEFVAGRSIMKATHEVTYLEQWGPFLPYRTEINKDESNEWLLHAAYRRAVGNGWKLGPRVTVNWKDHPKIPNYDLANIPRDPGRSIAYNIGIGAMRFGSGSMWGMEYIYEPISSYTWAELGPGPLPIDPSPQLPPNFKTVENFFDFSNHIFRIGVHAETNLDWLDYRLGAQLHFYSYTLDQFNNLSRTTRSMETDWLETTLGGGLTARFANVQLMYTLQLILGNGLVGVETGVAPNAAAIRNDFLIAPSADLVVDEITLVTQQLTFVYHLE